jgi:hypothetical protein
MSDNDLQFLLARHLEDMASRVEFLVKQGQIDDALVLRQEGLELAEAYDNEENFFFVQDWSTIE